MQRVHKTVDTKSRRFCSVPQCSSYKTKDISLHSFPLRDLKLCKQWQHTLRIGKPITKYMCVCSKHFLPADFFLESYPNVVTCRRRLKKGVIPTQNLPILSTPKTIKREIKIRRSQWIDKNRQVKTVPFNKELENENNNKNTIFIEETNSTRNEENKQEKPSTSVPFPECLQNLKNYHFTEDKGTQTTCYDFELPDLLNNDQKLGWFTGINYDTLHTYNRCAENVIGDCGASFRDLQRNIILVLCKLKLNLPFTCLAVLFSISTFKCSELFYSTVSLLASAIKPAIYWPTKGEILHNMPLAFMPFKDTRVVLDCTEIKLQKFKCLKSQVMSYSHYKTCHTAKFLIGITPSGLISYVSPAYGGRASDKIIFNQEKLIQKLDPYDAVMVDKGVLIKKECEEHLVKIHQPPFVKKRKQLSNSSAKLTAQIARARVHVERAIQRIKIFKIFQDQLTWNMIPYVDDIMTIIAATVNLSSPILADDKF